jgi:hypothetical protein
MNTARAAGADDRIAFRTREGPTPVVELVTERWDSALTPQEQAAATAVVESGGVLYFPRLGFPLAPQEHVFLAGDWSDGKAKNISFDGATGRLAGARGTADDKARLQMMVARFAERARGLVAAALPGYAQAVAVNRTSFRPSPAQDRETSWRKDDRLLHVDAFPSRPNHGARILRVFTNVNPSSEPRVWRLGEPFRDVAARFLADIPAPFPEVAYLLAALRITKGVRSRYDQMMLRLHDRMKADSAYQVKSPQAEVEFPAGSTWICFSDQVSHAAMRGQYVLEQTLELPVAAMHDPDRAPVAVLEQLTGRRLA